MSKHIPDINAIKAAAASAIGKDSLHPNHPDHNSHGYDPYGKISRKDADIPIARPTRFYDGFNGFTYPGAPPARNIDLSY